MRIVVTGALGHIGSKFIRDLPAIVPGVEIIMVDDLSSQRYCSLFDLPSAARYRFTHADVVEAPLHDLIASADALVHLAAITDAASSFGIQEQVERVNFEGTRRVARACADQGVPLVFLSTTSVYGTAESIVDETCPPSGLKPQSPYAESKLRAEQELKELGDSAGLRYVVCRFGTIFGTSIGMRFHTAINKFCWQAVMGEPLTVWRTALDQVRPYLALGDGSRALQHILLTRLFDNEIYNVLTVNATVRDIVETIQRYVPDTQVKLVDARIMNQLSYDVSAAKFAARGFQSRGDLTSGIRDTIQLLSAAQSRSVSLDLSEEQIAS